MTIPVITKKCAVYSINFAQENNRMKYRFRFKAFVLAALLSQMALLVAAQSGRSKKAMQKEDAVISKNLQTHISVLANDSLEGRRAGSPGEMKAVNYILLQYQRLGVPAADKNYVVPFEIDEGKAIGRGTKVIVNDTPLEKNTDFFPMVWSGLGKINDVSSVALQEQGAPWWYDLKEAMESNANNPHFLPEQYLKDMVKDATSKGATAVFVYNSGSKPDSLAFNRKDKAAAATIPVIYFTDKAIKKTGITAASSPAVDAAIELTEKKRTGHNVMAYLDNGAPTTIVIGAHLDHLGYGEDENTRNVGAPAIHNGADDNASGTAAVLELARMIKEKTASGAKKKNATQYDALRQNNYLFIHFSGEELGLYGSKYFVEHPSMEISKINYMLNMDMIGRLNDSSTLTVGGIGTSPLWSEVLPAAGTYGLHIKIDSSGTGPSDHTSFYRKDIPVLFFFTGLHSDYHKPTDDIEKVNFTGETKIIDYILDIISNAGPKGKFAFTKTKEQTMGSTRYKVSVGIMPDYTFNGEGVRADGVIDGRPAQKAGMQTGDVIIQLGDFPVTGMESYMQALNKFEKGQTTTLTIKRGSETKALQVTF
jgi:aminopeptidase YwaD